MTAAKARLPSLSALSAIGSTSLQGTTQTGPAMLPIDTTPLWAGSIERETIV